MPLTHLPWFLVHQAKWPTCKLPGSPREAGKPILVWFWRCHHKRAQSCWLRSPNITHEWVPEEDLHIRAYTSDYLTNSDTCVGYQSHIWFSWLKIIYISVLTNLRTNQKNHLASKSAAAAACFFSSQGSTNNGHLQMLTFSIAIPMRL